MNLVKTLPLPAFYFPPQSGRFTVTPGLFPLGKDFGNGPADARLFQFDSEFPRFRDNKLSCRAERFGKYVCADDFSAPIAEATIRLMTERLLAESPALFTRSVAADGTETLFCRLTGEIIPVNSFYRSGVFDALCSQVQEDIAIVRRTPERGEWVAALHLCAPSHWRAEDKIGKPFVAVHAPIPHFEKIAAAAESLTDSLIQRGPFVRFAWSVTFDDRLNAHPEPPPDLAPESWDGESPLYLRVERQTLWGIPDANAYLFAIRVYRYNVRDVCKNDARRDALIAAVRSMSPDSLRYKGLTKDAERVLEYLEGVAR